MVNIFTKCNFFFAGLPSRTIFGVTNLIAVAGKDNRILLSCPLSVYIPVTWIKDGTEIKPTSTNRYIISGGNLVVSNVDLNDEGRYVCKSKFYDGSVFKATFKVTINTKVAKRSLAPACTVRERRYFGGLKRKRTQESARERKRELPSIIDKQRQRRWCELGSTVIMRCKATGKPKPDVFWINEDGYSPISPPKVTQISASTLRINDIRESDSRTLICIAQNIHGRARARFSIFIRKSSKNITSSIYTRK
eukprot:gene15649-17228_t